MGWPECEAAALPVLWQLYHIKFGEVENGKRQALKKSSNFTCTPVSVV
jgi:hypothetical protein